MNLTQIVPSCYMAYRLVSILMIYFTVNGRPSTYRRSIVPYEITLFETVTWLQQELSYTFHLFVAVPANVFAVWLFRGRRRSLGHEDVINLMLNCSFVIFLEEMKASNDKVEAWKMHLDQLALPNLRGSYEQEIEIIIDSEFSEVLSFIFNGNEIKSSQKMLNLLLYALSFAVHPIVHSFENALRESCKSLPMKYWRMNAFAQYLNESSWFMPFLAVCGCGCGVDWGRKLSTVNSSKNYPHHGSFHPKLVSVSPFLRFSLEARKAIFEEFNRAGLHKVDKDAYFLCSVVHSLDHWALQDAINWVWFDACPETRGDGYGWFASMNIFYRAFPVAVHYDFLPNNYLKSHYRENDLYGLLYTRMYAADPRLANRVALSISF